MGGHPTVCPDDGAPVFGVNIRGVYDGVLFYGCPECGQTWDRGWSGRLAELATEHAARWKRDAPHQ